MKKLIFLFILLTGNFCLHAQDAKPMEKKPATGTTSAPNTTQPGRKDDKKAPGVRPKPVPAEQLNTGNQAKPGHADHKGKPHDDRKGQKHDDRKMKKDGTPDKRYKENKHVKKDGTPDMRYKENKEKEKQGGTAVPATKKAEQKK